MMNQEEIRAKLGAVVAGIDEAGRGPAFGPFVAAAVVLPDGFDCNGLADSKAISAKKRDHLFERVMAHAHVGIGHVTSAEIDAEGLGWCQKLVFTRALENLVSKGTTSEVAVTGILVDGVVFGGWRDLPFECVPKADALYPNVSAASIVAKVTRDRLIHDMCDAEPLLDERYGIRSNKGYLSKKHVDGIRIHGTTDKHRKSYNIKALSS